MSYALICINNHVFSCLVSLLSPTCVHAMWQLVHPHVCACVRVCVRVYACVCLCARMSNSWVKHPSWIFANPLISHTLYTCQNPKIMLCETISFFYLQVTWHNEAHDLITIVGFHLFEGVRDCI